MASDQQVLSLSFKPLFQAGTIVNTIVPLHNSKRLLECFALHQQNKGECSSLELANRVAIFLKRGMVANCYTIGKYKVLIKTMLEQKTTYISQL